MRIATRPPSQTRRDSAQPVSCPSSPSSGCLKDYGGDFKDSDDYDNYDVYDNYDGLKDDGIYDFNDI